MVSVMSSRLVAARMIQPAITIQVRQTTMALVLNWTLAVSATAVVFRKAIVTATVTSWMGVVIVAETM